MKFTVTIIFLFIAFVISIYNINEFTIYIHSLLFILFYLVLLLMEFSVFDKNLDSDFKIQSQRKLPKKSYFLFVFGYTALISFVDYSLTTKIFLILFIWASLFLEIIMFFLYKKKKPFILFIKNDELILLNGGTHKRDLIGLNRILFDRINKVFELRFDVGYKFRINTREFKKEDIDKLLEIVIHKSKHPISVPNNYKEEKD